MTTRDSEPPAVVGGRYDVGDLIGRGGAADVYRAHDRLLGRDVAVKMFVVGGEAVLGGSEPGGSADSGAEKRAAEERHRREVLTLAGLSHPGLVTVYDVGEQDGRAYFVMQLIEGDTLARRIRGGPLGVIDVIALGASLGDALAYVHRRGVVHRDVKPGNVLLDAEGRAHLSDFGIAAVHDAAPVTATGMVIGTASYLSPEQVRGEPVGPAVDVYALGLVLLECVTGRREYPGNALEAAVARLHRRPAVPTGLPGGLSVLLEAMTADDPAARPTAAEVVPALRGVSRDVDGMDAATVLSPALMSMPTAVHGHQSWTVAWTDGYAGGPAAPTPYPREVPAPAPAAPVRRSRRGLVTAAVGAVTALVLAGSVVAAYGVLGTRTAVPPAPPIGLAPELPATPSVTPAAEPIEESAAPTTEARRPRTTTTTEAPSRRAPAPTTTSTVPPAVPPPATSETGPPPGPGPGPGPGPAPEPAPSSEPEPEPEPEPSTTRGAPAA